MRKILMRWLTGIRMESIPAAQVGEADVQQQVEKFLCKQYVFRLNCLTDQTEFRAKREEGLFRPIGKRELNTLCIQTRQHGINCWDKDISRFIYSTAIPPYHPMRHYMDSLPVWDGIDRVAALSERISADPFWKAGFYRWMLGLAAQWMGKESLHANSVAPVLISLRQGMHKSTFCKMLMPDHLRAYYTDSFDLHSPAAAERKLSHFGLINLDEMDKYSARKMVWLKNIQQMSELSIRKAYQNHFVALPRMASFIGTSNRMDLLTDPTGSRRYLCVEITHKIDCSPLKHKQLYAQLKAGLESGERYWFTTGEEKALMVHNAPFHRLDAAEDVFHACYRLPREEEKGVKLSAADILSELKKKNPVAMKEVSFRSFTESLIALGAQRFHTRRGNLYEVIPLRTGV
ncbi:MAG: DUF3874 domain-containing protein [Tannerellaceae bacterium]|nr:DUF3874 domain-containing protein [Tannerellaceae bacterium]